MKSARKILFIAVFGVMAFGAAEVKAQCAMCTASVESNHKSGAATTDGLNKGILYLLAAPYLLAGVGGYIWYRNYRRKNIELDVPHDKLNLN
jgi:hypothetical protein